MGISPPFHHTRGRGRPSGDGYRPAAPKLIGVGVDGSPSGRDAVVLASLFARATHAERMLIAVYEEPVLAAVVPTQMGWTSVQKQARTMLVETRDSLAPDARVVVESDALIWRGLRHVVRREHRDLLVVGSGRQAREGEVTLGESARELLWHLECPLAIAPQGMRDGDKPPLERIGVGFVDGPQARAALELAGSIALAAGAEVEVRGVVDDRVPGGLRTEQVVLGGEAVVADQVRSLLDRTLTATRDIGVPVRVEVIPGNPTDSLRALGARVDLLVIGSGRSGPAGRVSLGSTGSALIDADQRPVHADVAGVPCPVLVVPRPGDDSAI